MIFSNECTIEQLAATNTMPKKKNKSRRPKKSGARGEFGSDCGGPPGGRSINAEPILQCFFNFCL
jgi:hypothetical protein